MFSIAIKDLRAGLSLYHVWLYQAYHEISAKYKRTALGSFWIAGQMVVTSLSLTIMFGALMGNSVRDILPYLMGGLMCYSTIGHILSEAPEVYLGNRGIISNHAYPFSYYNLEAVCKNIMLFLHNLVVYEIACAVIQAASFPHWTFIIGLPIVALNMFLWGSLSSMLGARFRDIRFLLPYLTQIAMFLSPIMYKPDAIQSWHWLIVDMNPIYPFVQMLRAPLLGHPMEMSLWPMALGVTAVGAVLWAFFFNAFRNRIAFWV